MNIPDAIATRSSRADLKAALMGGLLTLDDTQIRDRPGRGSSQVDRCDSHDGYRSTFQINLPFFDEAMNLRAGMPIGNLPGEWATEVHLKPLQWFSDKAVMTTSDSNAFVPAAIAYPLFLFEEDSLQAGQHIVREMRDQALANVRSYRSPQGGYNFWPRLPGGQAVKPFNLPVQLLESRWIRKLLVTTGIGPGDWIEQVMDKSKNPRGSLELTNIPDDADDTAIAVAVQELGRQAGQGSGDAVSLARLANYRDVDRSTPKDPEEQWQGANTGAYLTWLTQEHQDPFADPAHGVLPAGKNDVGPVVNANALLALSLCHQTSLPGYRQAVQLVIRTIQEKRWQQGTRYYPQPAVFPYCVARAWRDGKTEDPGLHQSMRILLRDVLGQQDEDGSFDGGEQDHSRALSTAMSVVALLNMGRQLAHQAGLAERYETAIEKGIQFLIQSGRSYPLQHFDTFNRLADPRAVSPPRTGRTWEPGVFFSGSPFGGTWRSQAYTVGVVVEALGKYVTAIDLGGPQRKIHPLRYATSADQAADDFQFRVGA